MEELESDELRPGQELLDFVTTRMKMSAHYQPLMLRTLIEHGCRCSLDELAKTFLLADDFEVARSRRIVMRWPHATLTKTHGFTRYDKVKREFFLPVKFEDELQRQQIIDACTKAIQTWNEVEGPRVASRFFAVIERAGGRCEACGVPGYIRALDVDHIIPMAKAKRAKVHFGPTNLMISVDDPRNLQALCTRCNRGKRDTSSRDFRPSEENLVDAISLVLAKANDLGLDAGSILEGAIAKQKGSEREAGRQAKGG